ncbi:hypothetical protein BGZ68_005606 [Mortierella alpina]|nr:hypothetical protein BGZ68_005606 [Mortierella alpina]
MARRLTWFSLTGITLTSSNVLCGIVALYGLPLTNGGPAWATWSFLVVGLMSVIVGLCLAELASSYPTTAGVHNWVYQLGSSRNRAFLTWMTGWLTIASSVASASSIAFYFSSILGQILLSVHKIAFTPGMLVMFHLGAVLFWQILNLLPVRVGTTVALAAVLLSYANVDPSLVHVPFNAFLNYSGSPNAIYAALSSTLMASFVFCPQDSIIRMAEECRRPERILPKLVTGSTWISLVLGFPLVVGLNYGVLQPMKGLLDEAVPAVRVILTTLGRSLGVVFISLVLTAIFFTGLTRLAMASRVAYALSRDGGLPKASYWNHLHARRKTAQRVSWLVTAGCMSGIFPFYWGDNDAFHWIASMACVATNLSFVVPLWLRLTRGGRRNHVRGPFSLGEGTSRFLNSISVIWLLFLSSILMLPSSMPLTRSNFNYTSAAIGAILVLTALSWCKAKYGFTGAAKEESRAAHRTTLVGSSASSMRRVSSSQYRQSQQRQRPSQAPLYLTPTSDSQYLGSNSSDQRSRSVSPNRRMRSSSKASRNTGITVPTEPGLDNDGSHHLKPSSQRGDEHHYGLPLTITTTSTFDPRGFDQNESHQGSGSSHYRHKSKRPGLSTTQTSYQSDYSSFLHGIPLYSSSEALSSPPASPSYRLPPWSDSHHPAQRDPSTPDIVVTVPPMNTPNVPEISIAPPTTVSSHDSRTSRTTSDIHIIHDSDEMYHHQHQHQHHPHPHHHGDDRALSSPTSSPPTSSAFRPPNATESIFRDLPQSPGHRPHVGGSGYMDSGGGGGGTKSGNMIVIHDDEHKEVLTKMPPPPARPHRKRRPPTPYPPSAADTSEPAPATSPDSPSGVEGSHRTQRSGKPDDDNNDHDHDDHSNSNHGDEDEEDDDDDDDTDDDNDDDDMLQSSTLSSPTRPELERRVAVYPILPYMKVNPPHSASNKKGSKKSKGADLQEQQQQQQQDDDHDDHNNNNIGSRHESHLREMDTTMDVDASYDAEYNHQYPVVSAYQSSHDLFKLPATSASAIAAASASAAAPTTSTSPAPDTDHDRASVSSLVRGGTSTHLYQESLHDRSTKDQAVAKWAQDQARIHQRRLQKRQARAEALQELRKAHAAAVVTGATAGPAGGEVPEASVSGSAVQAADQEPQAQMATTATTTATATAAAPLKVLLEENDDHHEKADGEKEDVQVLTVQQDQGPLEPIDRTETTGAGVGKPY